MYLGTRRKNLSSKAVLFHCWEPYAAYVIPGVSLGELRRADPKVPNCEPTKVLAAGICRLARSEYHKHHVQYFKAETIGRVWYAGSKH